MKIYAYSEWIDTAGGPFLLASATDCFSWNGVFSDYWSACEEVSDRVGVFKKKNREFIVFADEPLSASIVCCDIGILLLRWWGGEDAFDVFASLKFIDFEKLPVLEITNVNLEAGRYFLFDSALNGNTQKRHEIVLTRSVAFAKTYKYNPNKDNLFYINAFFY